MRILWLTLGYVALLLGLAGVVLPLVPTTPFLILSAFAFSKGSPRLERWLVDHPRFGPPIRDWREERALSRRAKWLASIVMAVTLVGGILARLSTTILLVQAVIFCAVALFLWTRPEPLRSAR
ncbi:hypothetical protein SAMN06297251_10787 [Fulvimarina manganoxydans]|uniref:Inner membrane protein n=1 Tax=Fulvimarina manganoxydans TaxID=937218 RepID=A0A1W2BR61_9HYPH|nr:YbaN family protein [Fulvimarina manganoxydans]MEE2952482.1 YbaN family protein [Pseudomonadota bacterium]SMC75477.1 hypothetical protein SAMN06297251_10787 [Fulvimarina manganoxydans]